MRRLAKQGKSHVDAQESRPAFLRLVDLRPCTVCLPALAAEDGEFEEIIVTASKRETRLMETPLAITAFPQGYLDREGIRTARDLATTAPNVQLGVGDDSGTAATIRGVTSTDFTEVGEGAVAIHVELFGENVTDEDTKNFFGFNGGVVKGNYDPPRTYGLRGVFVLVDQNSSAAPSLSLPRCREGGNVATKLARACRRASLLRCREGEDVATELALACRRASLPPRSGGRTGWGQESSATWKGRPFACLVRASSLLC